MDWTWSQLVLAVGGVEGSTSRVVSQLLQQSAVAGRQFHPKRRNAETPRVVSLCTTVASAMDEIISEEEFSGSDYVPYSTSRQQVTAKPYGVPFKGGEPASRSLPPPTTKAKSGRQPQDAAAGGGVLTKMARSRHRVRPSCASGWEIAGDRYDRYTSKWLTQSSVSVF